MNASAALAPDDPHRSSIVDLGEHLKSRIVGQADFVDKLLIALLADGHVLLEGAPGLAKTKAVRLLSEAIECSQQRVQFTPDLLPSDLTGTDVYRPETGAFEFVHGPIFHNLVLADEINRAPAKVQSALLEAMAERQVSVGGRTWPLPALFMVLATQNPIEQEGTYPLPEAQLDRFLLHVRIGFPDLAAEREILHLVRDEAMGVAPPPHEPLPQAVVFEARQLALRTFVSPALEEYVLQLVHATRHPELYGDDLAGAIEWGASPRGTLALERCARVHAWLRGAGYASPADVRAVARDVLGHRIVPSFEAEADGLTRERLIDALLERVPVG